MSCRGKCDLEITIFHSFSDRLFVLIAALILRTWGKRKTAVAADIRVGAGAYRKLCAVEITCAAIGIACAASRNTGVAARAAAGIVCRTAAGAAGGILAVVGAQLFDAIEKLANLFDVAVVLCGRISEYRAARTQFGLI